MSKPRVDPTFGISSVDVLILTERHPAYRWREAQPGSCKERENLAGDAKGKGPSGPNRKAESTDAPAAPRESNTLCPLATMPRQRPNIGSRVTREGHVRFWERPRVKGPRATCQKWP